MTPPQTTGDLLDAYEAEAERLSWPWRWWYRRKARIVREAWDRRRDEALLRALLAEYHRGERQASAHIDLREDGPA